MNRRCGHVPVPLPSAFDGFRLPPEVIMLSVRWYLRFNLSYRDVEELLRATRENGPQGTLRNHFRWSQAWSMGTAPVLVDGWV